jgi:hypothetical protein
VTRSTKHNYQSRIDGHDEDIFKFNKFLKSGEKQQQRHSHWFGLIEKNSVCRLPLLTKSRNGCISIAVSCVPSCSALHIEKKECLKLSATTSTYLP